MKIGIITVFDAVNYGSFLQAFALQNVLKDLGSENIKFIKISSKLYEKWRFTSLFTYKPNKIPFKYKLAKGYFKIWKNFKSTRSKQGFDLVIVGSDEMWELKNITFVPQKEFFGGGVESKRIITYAVSCNGTKPKDIESNIGVTQYIKNLDAISVRDKATFEAYKNQIPDNTPIHIDPTLLIDMKRYIIPTNLSNYILVYTYGFTSERIKAVKELAIQTNKQIVVVGQNFEWADICIPADAFEFLGLINSADYIVTDTFHGTVLSIALRKEFVSFAYKSKVFNVLKRFNLMERNVNDDSVLYDVLSNKINYLKVYEMIEPLKNESLDYLAKNIICMN